MKVTSILAILGFASLSVAGIVPMDEESHMLESKSARTPDATCQGSLQLIWTPCREMQQLQCRVRLPEHLQAEPQRRHGLPQLQRPAQLPRSLRVDCQRPPAPVQQLLRGQLHHLQLSWYCRGKRHIVLWVLGNMAYQGYESINNMMCLYLLAGDMKRGSDGSSPPLVMLILHNRGPLQARGTNYRLRSAIPRRLLRRLGRGSDG
jgi:hypothetical protein